MNLTIPTFCLGSIGPWITLSVTAIIILLADALSPRGNRAAAPGLALVGLVVAAFQTYYLWGQNIMDFARMVYVDNFSLFFYLIFILGTILTVLISLPYLKDYDKNLAEYYALVLFATVGMMIMAAGSHLIMIFLGLEIMSIAIYVLAGLFREDARSNEAALKYLILGGFASAFLLFGMAMLYGAAGGTLFLSDLAPRLAGANLLKPLTLLAMALLLAGFGFKVASVPFHMWTPDVYEGAPTSVTAFMAVGVKAAAFAAFARIFFLAFPGLQIDYQMVLWVLAVATMTLGNVVAIAQTNIKRMLAYSSIAHAGYLMMAIIAANQLGAVSLMYYLLAYTLMNLGAFGVVILVGRKQDKYLSIYDYSGLGFQQPVLGAAMALFMFALAGMPPTAGFVGKFYVFSAAVKAGYIWLAIIGVMNSLVSVYYYLRITVLMYMKPAEADLGAINYAPGLSATLIITAIGVLFIGIFPGFFYDLAMASVKAFPGL